MDDELSGIVQTEYAEGTIQCAHCDYWGTMEGFIKAEDTKYIYFVCPVEGCNSIERVTNPLA